MRQSCYREKTSKVNGGDWGRGKWGTWGQDTHQLLCLGAEEGVDPDDEGRGGAEHLEQFAREDGDVGEAVRTHTHTCYFKSTHTQKPRQPHMQTQTYTL